MTSPKWLASLQEVDPLPMFNGYPNWSRDGYIGYRHPRKEDAARNEQHRQQAAAWYKRQEELDAFENGVFLLLG